MDLSKSFKRCVIQKIENLKLEKILHLKEKSSQQFAKCCLKGIWYETSAEVGDIVSVQGVWNQERNMFVVSSESGIIVTSPDTLISGTSITGSLFCPRKSVLSERFKLKADVKIVKNFI